MEMRNQNLVKRALMLSAVASGSLLAGAHLFEAAGYLPCQLCLDQREAHWAALALAVAGTALTFFDRMRVAAAAAIGAIAFIYALSAGLAFYHTGVEYGYFPAYGCETGAASLDHITTADFAAAFAGETSIASCSDPAWRMFGISMAGYNFLISSGLFVICLGAAVTTTRHFRVGPEGEHSFAS